MYSLLEFQLEGEGHAKRRSRTKAKTLWEDLFDSSIRFNGSGCVEVCQNVVEIPLVLMHSLDQISMLSIKHMPFPHNYTIVKSQICACEPILNRRDQVYGGRLPRGAGESEGEL